MTPPVAVTIAGTDPTGGAGLAADLRTFAALGVHGTFAISVVTAQTTAEFRRAVPLDHELVIEQLTAVLDDLPVAAVKTGMLLDPELVSAVAHRLDSVTLVVDPVCADRHGRPLAGSALPAAYLEHLIPRATVLTPNRAEAALLTGRAVDTAEEAARAASELVERGPSLVVVTGGASGVDAVADSAGVEQIERAVVETRNDHGSGCTLAAAITAGLAWGHSPAQAVAEAGEFVARALAGAAHWQLGSGRGPLDQPGAGR